MVRSGAAWSPFEATLAMTAATGSLVLLSGRNIYLRVSKRCEAFKQRVGARQKENIRLVERANFPTLSYRHGPTVLWSMLHGSHALLPNVVIIPHYAATLLALESASLFATLLDITWVLCPEHTGLHDESEHNDRQLPNPQRKQSHALPHKLGSIQSVHIPSGTIVMKQTLPLLESLPSSCSHCSPCVYFKRHCINGTHAPWSQGLSRPLCLLLALLSSLFRVLLCCYAFTYGYTFKSCS
jgi:hypothetical protein